MFVKTVNGKLLVPRSSTKVMARESPQRKSEAKYFWGFSSSLYLVCLPVKIFAIPYIHTPYSCSCTYTFAADTDLHVSLDNTSESEKAVIPLLTETFFEVSHFSEQELISTQMLTSVRAIL